MKELDKKWKEIEEREIDEYLNSEEHKKVIDELNGNQKNATEDEWKEKIINEFDKINNEFNEKLDDLGNLEYNVNYLENTSKNEILNSEISASIIEIKIKYTKNLINRLLKINLELNVNIGKGGVGYDISNPLNPSIGPIVKPIEVDKDINIRFNKNKK